uniref:Uncharacterized protein n=1 Tax=viral metagenome TaxID=1070528 RepID=A0A6C0I206_9ZZZZ
MSVSQKTCADGVAKYIELAEQYNKDLEEYKQKLEMYNYEVKQLNDWELKKGAYSWYQDKQDDLENEKRTWLRCADKAFGAFAAITNASLDERCQAAQGEGWVHGRIDGWWWTQADCGIFGLKGICKRTPEKVLSDLNTIYTYNKGKPFVTPKPPMPLSPSGDITCCGIDISKLTAGNNINISNIKQECGKKINSTTSDPTTSDPKSTIIEFITTNIRIIILVISIIIALILISF